MLADVRHQTEAVRYLRRFVDGALTSPVLLVGASGVGRRFSVQQAVSEAFCMGERAPKCDCYSCLTIIQGTHPDFVTLTADSKDIGVDAVRDLTAKARDYPSVASMRCFLIDGADRFTVPAANALLKTLEEPPAKSRFFLISETSEQVLPTIRSRCGQLRYNRLPEAFVLSVLLQYEHDDAKALVYSRMGEGSAGNAIQYWGAGRLSLRDQVFRVVQNALDRDLAALFSSVDAMEKDIPLALKFLEQLLHDVLMIRVDPMRVIHVDRMADLKALEPKTSLRVWVNLANKARALQGQYRTTPVHLPFHLKTIFTESFI